MGHKKFSVWLRAVIIGTTLIGLSACIFVLPGMARILSGRYPEFSYWVRPWMAALYIAALPCFAAMGICWKIACNIGKDRSFSRQNAGLFKVFSWLALGDSAYFFAVSIIYWMLGMNHPGLVIIDLLIVFIGLAVFVCTSALSYLVAKAAGLQEDSDLTI